MNDWRLFIDSSTSSLKGVFAPQWKQTSIHSYSILVPDERTLHMLDHINYCNNKWDVIGDFNMLCFLTGMQGGYTKYSCFTCMWDSRRRENSNHYTRKVWPRRGKAVIGIKHKPLVDILKILLPPLVDL